MQNKNMLLYQITLVVVCSHGTTFVRAEHEQLEQFCVALSNVRAGATV
jgi:hypothetical protein